LKLSLGKESELPEEHREQGNLKEEVEEPEEKVDKLEYPVIFFYIFIFYLLIETNVGPDCKYYGLKYDENGIGCYL